jgi:hypothetical protein
MCLPMTAMPLSTFGRHTDLPQLLLSACNAESGACICPRALVCDAQEPLQQTAKQIHVAFDALLDIEESQQHHAAALGLPADAAARTESFLEGTAREIMSAGSFFCLFCFAGKAALAWDRGRPRGPSSQKPLDAAMLSYSRDSLLCRITQGKYCSLSLRCNTCPVSRWAQKGQVHCPESFDVQTWSDPVAGTQAQLDSQHHTGAA